MRTPIPHAPRRPATLGALGALTLGALTLAACDAAAPPRTTGPDPLPVTRLSDAQRAAAVRAFEDVEALGERGLAAPAGKKTPTLASLAPAALRSALAADTVIYTGVYNAAQGLGYLVTVRRTSRLGAPIYTAAVQWGRDSASGNDPVETVTLYFLGPEPLGTFLTALASGTNAYLRTGAHGGTDALTGSPFPGADEWRVSQLSGSSEGGAAVTYAAQDGAREAFTVRDPVVARNADGTCTARDGGSGGRVRTRTYAAGCAVSAAGAVAGTVSRTVYSGAGSDGSVVTRTEDAATGTWREVRQKGGDGVVVRTTTEG